MAQVTVPKVQTPKVSAFLDSYKVSPYTPRNSAIAAFNAFGTPSAQSMNMPTTGAGGLDLGDTFQFSGQSGSLAAPTPPIPEVGGSWLEKGKLGLGAAQVGLGIYNALEQSKMNKFMKGYYGDQLEMQEKDFQNTVKSTNEGLSTRAGNKMSMLGYGVNSDEYKAGVADQMTKWGVSA